MNAIVNLTAKDKAAADPGPQDNPKDAPGPGAGPIGGLGQGKAVRVVRQAHRAPQASGKVRAEGSVV
jgi:hypothetical protein